MIHYHKGDLIKSDCDVIAHGCNCFCTWGAGIARQLRSVHPEAFQADLATEVGDIKKLGTFTQAMSGQRQIFNLYTQFRYGVTEPHFDYDAFRNSLSAMRDYLEVVTGTLHTAKIGLPKIGAGLAGGNWERISQIIDEVMLDVDVHVYVLDDDPMMSERCS